MAELTPLLIKGVHILMNIKVGSEDHILQDSTDVKICVCVCVCVCVSARTHTYHRQMTICQEANEDYLSAGLSGDIILFFVCVNFAWFFTMSVVSS